jgi:hypothetical protein
MLFIRQKDGDLYYDPEGVTIGPFDPRPDSKLPNVWLLQIKANAIGVELSSISFLILQSICAPRSSAHTALLAAQVSTSIAVSISESDWLKVE